MRKHRDLYSLDEETLQEKIKERKRKYEYREKRKQLILEIAEQEQVPLEQLQDNQDYLHKIELGKQIIVIINEGVVKEQSLSRSREEALDFYRKQTPMRNMIQVELRLWQQELMDMIGTPTEREVIWVLGIKGEEGKTWFQDYLSSVYGYGRVLQLDLK